MSSRENSSCLFQEVVRVWYDGSKTIKSNSTYLVFFNKSTIEIGRSFLASSVNLLDKERDLVLLAANREVEAPG